MKKLISLLLSVVMVFTVFSVALTSSVMAADTAEVTASESAAVMSIDLGGLKIPTSWDELGNVLLKSLYNVADQLIDVILKGLNKKIPAVQFEKKENFTSEMFFEGMEDYLSAPAANAVWSLGYGSASLQTGDELDGKHYVGGSLSFPKTKAATEIYDDQRVRVIAVNDGSGRGTIVFASLDAFGLSYPDVRGIRKELADFAAANNIVGINISVLHQHSCVDTFGMNGDLLKMIFTNPALNVINNTFGTDYKLLNGQNESFMEHLYDVTVDSIKQAVNSMTTGKMYYSEIEAGEFIHDKREPMVYDTKVHRFRFVPDNGTKETWLCNMAIHCVGNGAAGTAITGDYPYYVEQEVNKAGANYIQIQGAELAITTSHSSLDIPEGTPRLESLKIYGTALGKHIVESDAAETEVAPLLNYRMKEYTVPVTNQILAFAGKLGALTNKVVATDDNNTELEVVTELGYLEFGTELAVAVIPGELEPAIAYGGYLDAENSWTGTDFDYPTLQEIVGADKELLVFGLTNDQIGYILEDNDYSSILSGVNEEIVATGCSAGSTTINAFEELVDSIGR
ncbi:MAG: hypothetical protein PUJ59_04175 [Clostridiaceae bacterium]|nr:hypothetical protein [Clostridiaceae bacterium]MDY5889136.1 hypothetical protein [Oscillospiraceae bacterium]